MKAERARLARLKRLEKLRAIARQTALSEAGRAEARLADLETLGQRTATLITGYATRTDADCGADLVRQRIYLGELQRMATRTEADVARARDQADARAAVEDRATATAQRIARHQAAAAVPLGSRPSRKT